MHDSCSFGIPGASDTPGASGVGRAWLTAACVAAVMLCTLTACAGPSSGNPDSEGTEGTMETAGGYDLNAHYAAELRQARRTLQDDGADFAVGILEDGVITQSELAELNDHVLQCLGDLGHDTDSITMGELGEISARPSSGASQAESAAWGGTFNQDVKTCSTRDGARTIWQLASAAEINPDNDGKDARQIIIDCYVKQGLVSESYSIDDYERDSRAGTGPFDAGKRADAGFRQKVEACG